MIVVVKQIEKLLNLYHDKIDIQYLEDYRFRGHRFNEGDIIILENLSVFSFNKIDEINVKFSEKLYYYLVKEFGKEYREYSSTASFYEMDKKLENFKIINKKSNRKRHFLIHGDIFKNSTNQNSENLILNHGEKLDYENWNLIKKNLNKKELMKYRTSETGILIFVDMTETDEVTYVDKFKKNTDLISVMVSERDIKGETISKDFQPIYDVNSVTNYDNLLPEYIKTNSRMIIIGEPLTDKHKKALMSVRKYDPYVRMMVVPTLDHNKLDHFFKTVKYVYNGDRWET